MTKFSTCMALEFLTSWKELNPISKNSALLKTKERGNWSMPPQRTPGGILGSNASISFEVQIIYCFNALHMRRLAADPRFVRIAYLTQSVTWNRKKRIVRRRPWMWSWMHGYHQSAKQCLMFVGLTLLQQTQS